MLRRINKLFQKTSWLKTKETGDHKAVVRGRITAETPQNSTQQRVRQNQHGRTMTEMLGVLAIVGILSIGALAGYRYAMDKQRANVTINDINLRGVDLIIQAGRNIPLNLEEWGNTSSAGYTFGTPELVDGFVKLPISGLPERVCEMVVDGLSGQFDIDVGAYRYMGDTSLCGENNTVTVYFDSEGKTGKACDSDTACGECATCRSGVCVAKADHSSCSGGYCEAGVCVPRGDVTDSNPVTDSEYVTDSEWVTDTQDDTGTDTQDETGTVTDTEPIVCPPDRPLIEWGNCHSCDEEGGIYVGGAEESCSACPNRVLAGSYCALPCPANKPLMDYEGNCHSCDETINFNVYGVTKNCSVCSNRVLGGSDNQYCVLPCPADKPLMASNGTCYSCDETSRVLVSGVMGNCSVCKNREVKNNNCILSECPTDKPLQDYDGTCHSCDTAKGIYVWSVEGNCSVCSDRVLVKSYCALPCSADKPLMDMNGNCHSCDTRSDVSVYRVTENCAVCKNREVKSDYYCVLSKVECPADKPLKDDGGRCFSCDTTTSVDVRGRTEDCSVCKNRIVNGLFCVLPCPADKPLMDSGGTCYSCDEPGSVYVWDTGNCSVCRNRIVNGDRCILPCPADKPLIDNEGNCHSCAEERSVLVWDVEGNCLVCPNREIMGHYCALK